MVCVRWPQHQAAISSTLKQFWEDAVFTDVTLAVAGGCAAAHRAVLAARSPALRRMLLDSAESAPLVVFLRGVSEPQLRLLLQLIYTGCARASRHCISELRELCRELEIDHQPSDLVCSAGEPADDGAVHLSSSPTFPGDGCAPGGHVLDGVNSSRPTADSEPAPVDPEEQPPQQSTSTAELWLSSVSARLPDPAPSHDGAADLHYVKESIISIPSSAPPVGQGDGTGRADPEQVLPSLQGDSESVVPSQGPGGKDDSNLRRTSSERPAGGHKPLSRIRSRELPASPPQAATEAYQHVSALLAALRYDELRGLHEQACNILFQDFTSWLPDEILLAILSLLGPRDLMRASGCCRRWRQLAADDAVWRRCCRLTCAGGAIDDYGGAGAAAVPGGQSFRQLCMQWIAWTEQPMPRPRILKGHNSVVRCMAVDGDRVVTGSSDKTVAVWSISVGRLERILCFHSEVTSVQISGELVVAASRNYCLTVWDAVSGQEHHTLAGHEGIVRCVALHGTRAASGSDDKTVRLWDVVTGELLAVLRRHETVVRAVCFDGRHVVSGDDAGCVRVWNAETRAEEEAWQATSRYVMVLQHACGVVVSGHGDGAVNVWDMASRRLLYGVRDPGGWVTDLSIKDGRMLSGCKDGTALLWDLASGERVRLTGEQGHRQRVTSVRLLTGLAITASRDGHVKLWHGRHGTFIRSLVTPELSQGPVKQLWAASDQLICGVQNNASDRPHLLLFDMRLKHG